MFKRCGCYLLATSMTNDVYMLPPTRRGRHDVGLTQDRRGDSLQDVCNTRERVVPAKQSAASVFIVDDDPAVRNAVKLLVHAFGLQAEGYDSAEAFLDACKPGQPGCLVLDLHMPSMNGVELLLQLAARGLDIPVIIITATPDEPLAVRAMKAGAVAVLAKPIKADELQRSIQRALSQAD